MKPSKGKRGEDQDNNQENKMEEKPDDVVEAAEMSDTSEEVPEANSPEIGSENELKAALAAEKDRFLRLAAEYDNFRKRSIKERESIFTDVRADTIARFLPVYDNLSRAANQESQDEAYKKGVEMILTQLCEAMEKLGVVEIPSVGEIFQPEVHNAVMHVEDPDKGEGEIVEEFEKGFKLGDRVIRFSTVKVAN